MDSSDRLIYLPRAYIVLLWEEDAGRGECEVGRVEVKDLLRVEDAWGRGFRFLRDLVSEMTYKHRLCRMRLATVAY